MKTKSKFATLRKPRAGKPLTLGDLIASTYAACGKQAPKLLRLALESHLIRLQYGPGY